MENIFPTSKNPKKEILKHFKDQKSEEIGVKICKLSENLDFPVKLHNSIFSDIFFKSIGFFELERLYNKKLRVEIKKFENFAHFRTLLIPWSFL